MSKGSLLMALGLVLLFSTLLAGCANTPAASNTTTSTPVIVNVTAAVAQTTVTVVPSVSVLPSFTLAPGNLTPSTSLIAENRTPSASGTDTVSATTTIKASATPTDYMEQDSDYVGYPTLAPGTGIVTPSPVVTTPTNTPSGASYPIDSRVLTTHERVVLPVSVPSTSPKLLPYDVSNYSQYGYGVWRFGDGLGYQKMTLGSPAYNNTSVTHTARLLNFFDITDIHITDKETPTQGIFFGYRGGQSSGYSPVMLSTTQVLDAAVQTINALHTSVPFDFGISLGDAANNAQYNEIRWYIDVLDGRTINPDSGAKDDPVPGPLNDYQDEYTAAGLNATIPWYQALGNHDHNWLGTNPPDDYLKANYTGEYILNMGDIFRNPLGIKSRGFYMGSIDGRTVNGDIIGVGNVTGFSTPPRVLAADPNRRALSVKEWMGEFFNTSSTPKGHGFNQSDVQAGFACYSFEPESGVPIKVIVLDDTQRDTDADVGGYGHGTLDNERYAWLIGELDKGQAEGKLMIIAAHVPVGVESGGSTLDEYVGWSSVAQVSEKKLMAQLHTYPNLILWIAGHRHYNVVTAQKSPDPDRPELGFWEVETASLRDFPQQFRTFEIVRNSDNTISIFTTDVDPAVSDGSIAGKSRSFAVAARQIFNSSSPYPPSASLNAELVTHLSPEMQEKIRNYGTPLGT